MPKTSIRQWIGFCLLLAAVVGGLLLVIRLFALLFVRTCC